MTDEVNTRRVDKAEDNAGITPLQMLRYLADEIEMGRLKCTKLGVVTVLDGKDVDHEHATWWAGGVSWLEGSGILAVALDRSIRRYRGIKGEEL